MKFTRSIGVAAAAVAVLGLSACGTTSDDTAGEKAGGGPVSVVDATGTEVKLDAPATRVVATEWQEVENVLALGVTPVGISDTAGFKTWDNALALPDSVKDVGKRGQEDAGAVQGLTPDLVIVTEGRKNALVDRLREAKIPVFVTASPAATDPLGGMRKTFTDIAALLGKSDGATTILKDYDAKITAAKSKLADLPADARRYFYFDAYASGASVKFRPFGPGSLVGGVAAAIGLENVWTGETDPAYGLGEADLEGLTKVGDAWMLYSGAERSEWLTPVEKNPIWQNLPANKNNRLKAFPDGIWTFGGPLSAGRIADAFVASLGK